MFSESAPQTSAALTPMIQQLIDAVNEAKANVTALQSSGVSGLDKRQLDSIIGPILSGILTVRIFSETTVQETQPSSPFVGDRIRSDRHSPCWPRSCGDRRISRHRAYRFAHWPRRHRRRAPWSSYNLVSLLRPEL